MSFFKKFKSKPHDGQRGGDEDASVFDDVGASSLEEFAEVIDEARDVNASPSTQSMTTASVEDASILTEAVPSELAGDFLETRMSGTDEGGSSPRKGSGLPGIGHMPLTKQWRTLGLIGVLSLVTLLVGVFLANRAVTSTSIQEVTSSRALAQSQRLAKSASQALLASPNAFAELKDSAAILSASGRALKDGSDGVRPLPAALQPAIEAVMPMIENAEKNALAMVAAEKTLTEASKALSAINRQSSELLETAEAVSSLKLQQGASAAELSAIGQVVMLTQRIGKSANEFLTLEGVSPEAVFLLGKDLSSFNEITSGLLEGNAELRLTSAKDAATKEALGKLLKDFSQTETNAKQILSQLQGLVAARDAHEGIIRDSEPLRKGLEDLSTRLSTGGGFGGITWSVLALGLLGMLASAYGLLRVFVADQGQRALMADKLRIQAERQEKEAKRVNDANQAAILRLMNELQTVAEGDLTQTATVTEDITGAIADSVNYTVEELRLLVTQVQGTAGRVTDTTQQVESTSTELLAASTEQLREIRETGESVLQMAGRINEVASRAQQSAEVARQSLSAAESGRAAVQNTIGGMNTMREQIQETSKRIKRLGESSQEIGEITELISDITEQTNVLALNAAIQAASAGEAGRGFSVVAEEVQRLAERSGDATRQIAALVKTIQADTQDAVAAMERSTQGVVESTKLSDAAGSALTDIDRVTRELAELIEQISREAQDEAKSANVVAGNIQHIFAVTEQTGAGTRSTAQMVRELSRTAELLKDSVARFKVS
jgi:twitching motility protein PilJ